MNPLDIASHGPVIPVIVIDRVEDALPLAEALLAGGVKVLEVTLRTASGLPSKPSPAICPRPWWVWARCSTPMTRAARAKPVRGLP